MNVVDFIFNTGQNSSISYEIYKKKNRNKQNADIIDPCENNKSSRLDVPGASEDPSRAAVSMAQALEERKRIIGDKIKHA